MKLPFKIDLTNKVAVVTGGSGVLCSELAAALAANGAKVAVLGRNAAAAEKTAVRLRELGASAIGISADVLQRQTLESAAERVLKELGPCDLLINGAGGNDPRGTTSKDWLELDDLADKSLKTFVDLDPAGVESVFSLNFLDTLLPTRIFARQMIGRAGCSIINVSSMNAFRPLSRIPAYSGAKAAVSNFTQWLAVHFSKKLISVEGIRYGNASRTFGLGTD